MPTPRSKQEHTGDTLPSQRQFRVGEIIRKTLERDCFMTAEEAKKFGVIDQIIDNRDQIKV